MQIDSKRIFIISVKYRGRCNNIAERVVDRAVDRARAVRGAKAESSQIQVGRVAQLIHTRNGWLNTASSGHLIALDAAQ
ncbi:unnamed protein product [Lathyrus oleraceus]